jgi:oxygen-independent coproporphyrinogen-3 oxidase
MKEYNQIQATYIHTPFCVQKCLYCDFASYACRDTNIMKEYAQAVCREIASYGAVKLPVNSQATIYFGGGTPSTLPIECIEQIVAALKENKYWQEPAEATIEVNPGTADLEKLKALRALGFDRISFGVQSLNDSELKTIGRIHSAREALQAIAWAKEAGFARISADLIYALPGQTLESLRATLEQLVATSIEHVSVYGLIVEEGTPLAKLVDEGKLILPDEDTAADMYEFVQSFLKEQGFDRYEISNYAKNGQYSKHNLVYWKYQPYAAFGAAACGFDGSSRFTASEVVADYINQTKGTLIYNEENLSSEELLGEFMFMGLRKKSGANLREARERFGIDVMEHFASEMEPFFQKGMLAYDSEKEVLYLTEAGMELGNLIFEIFVTI